jgi:hypothetical protein
MLLDIHGNYFCMRNFQGARPDLCLKTRSWGVRHIADELGVSKNTVKRYLRQGGWAP